MIGADVGRMEGSDRRVSWACRERAWAMVAIAMAFLMLSLPGVDAAFTANTSTTASFASLDLDTVRPLSASSSRVSPTSCHVTWTPSPSAPVGMTYDVSDGTSTVRTAAGATNATIVVGNTAATLTVKARYGSWTSAEATQAGICQPGPELPGNLTLSPGDQSITASWTAPDGNGHPVTGYVVTATPTAGAGHETLPPVICAPAGGGTSCVVSGLVNGVTYTVGVSATTAVGTGAPAIATTTPYPAVLGSSSVKVWLDAQDSASLSAATDCSGTNAAAGAGIGCWKTRTSNAWNAISGSNKPALTANAINGRTAMRFDRTKPNMFEIASAGIGNVGSRDRTIFAVAAGRTTTDATTNDSGVIAMWPGYHSGLELQNYPTIASATAIGYAADNAALSASTSVNGASVISAVSVITSGGMQQDVGINGQSPQVSIRQHPAVPLTWRTFSGEALRIGSMTDSVGDYSIPLDGDIGELIIVESAVSSADRRVVDEYLARKWGIAVTPLMPGTPTAVASDGQATISWDAPAWDGGSPVTGYTVVASPGGQTCTTTGETSCTITGLTDGTTYTFTVAAINSAGTGPASPASAGVTPKGAPSAPTGVTATPRDSAAAISWTAPFSNGGWSLSGYQATATPTAGLGYESLPTRACTTMGSTTCSVGGLTNGITYTVTVTASNTGNFTGPPATTTVIPYPAGVLDSAAVKVWLDAQDSASLLSATNCSGTAASAGEGVGCWKNRTGNNWNAVSGASKPVVTSNAINGRSAIRFKTSTLDRFAITNPGVGAVGSNDRTMFAVATGRSVLDSTFNNFGAIAMWPGTHSGLRYSPQNMWSIAWNAAGKMTDPMVPTSGPAVLSSIASTSSGQVSLDIAANGGPPQIGPVRPAPWQTVPDNLRIGSMSDTMMDYAYPLDGDVGEVIVLNTAVSVEDRRAVEEYLSHKWGVALVP